MPSDPGEIIWTPIPIALRELAPVLFENGVAAYERTPLAKGEVKIEPGFVRSATLAAGGIGLLVRLVERPVYAFTACLGNEAQPLTKAEWNMARERVHTQLRDSFMAVKGLSEDEYEKALYVYGAFENTKVLHEEMDLDEWVLEVFWPLFACEGEPRFRSALCAAIGAGLVTRGIGDRMRMVWDDRLP